MSVRGSDTRVLPMATDDRPARPLPPAFTLLVAGLVVVATGYGLVVDDAYRLVSDLTRETWRAQDAVTLTLVPVLLWSTRQARAGSLSAHLASVGILVWLTYGYAHLAVGAPLNPVFLVYVGIFCLAGFGALDGIVRVDVAAAAPAFARVPLRAAAGFLAVGGVGIAALWLIEIVGALPDDLPPNIHLSELPNPTWVLDLGVMIPMVLAAAVLLRRRHPAGPVLASVMLVALSILSAAMLTLTPFALAAGLDADPATRQQIVGFTVVFVVLGAVEAWLLVRGRVRLAPVTSSWLRRGWWPTTDLERRTHSH